MSTVIDYDELFEKLCRMPGYPCKDCVKRSMCGNTCGDWFTWFAWNWRSVQRRFGIDVPDLNVKPAYKPDRSSKR